MIPFKTTPEQVINLAGIVTEMNRNGLSRDFIVEASELARSDQGVFDLMSLWLDAGEDPGARSEIVADIQESIDDYQDAPQAPVKKPYVGYSTLDALVTEILKEKAKLRLLVDRHGGVSAVAQKSGIPQPSLSRMLNSASMPRRSTLYKIANALDLSESDIVAEWTR
jgi:DNA-binding phage protein